METHVYHYTFLHITPSTYMRFPRKRVERVYLVWSRFLMGAKGGAISFATVHQFTMIPLRTGLRSKLGLCKHCRPRYPRATVSQARLARLQRTAEDCCGISAFATYSTAGMEFEQLNTRPFDAHPTDLQPRAVRAKCRMACSDLRPHPRIFRSLYALRATQSVLSRRMGRSCLSFEDD